MVRYDLKEKRGGQFNKWEEGLERIVPRELRMMGVTKKRAGEPNDRREPGPRPAGLGTWRERKKSKIRKLTRIKKIKRYHLYSSKRHVVMERGESRQMKSG